MKLKEFKAVENVTQIVQTLKKHLIHKIFFYSIKLLKILLLNHIFTTSFNYDINYQEIAKTITKL